MGQPGWIIGGCVFLVAESLLFQWLMDREGDYREGGQRKNKAALHLDDPIHNQGGSLRKKLKSWAVVGALILLSVTTGIGAMMSTHPWINGHLWVADLCFTLAGLLFIFKWVIDEDVKTSKLKLGGCIAGVTVAIGLGWLNYYINIPSAPVTALVMQCQTDFLPIAVAPHAIVTILRLNSKPEFVTQSNNEETTFHWPTKEEATIPKDDPPIISKCRVASLAQVLEDISITLDIGFGKKQIKTDIQFPLLNQGSAEFFMVNECPLQASVIIPDTARAKVLGEYSRREIPLHGADPSSIGKIVGPFFPSHAKWADDPDCLLKEGGGIEPQLNKD